MRWKGMDVYSDTSKVTLISPSPPADADAGRLHRHNSAHRELSVMTVMDQARNWRKRIGKCLEAHRFLNVFSIVRCKKCKGEKTVDEKTRIELAIEKGMTDRQRIVLAGAGDQKVSSAIAPTVSALWLSTFVARCLAWWRGVCFESPPTHRIWTFRKWFACARYDNIVWSPPRVFANSFEAFRWPGY